MLQTEVKEVKWGYFKVEEDRSILESCWACQTEENIRLSVAVGFSDLLPCDQTSSNNHKLYRSFT